MKPRFFPPATSKQIVVVHFTGSMCSPILPCLWKMCTPPLQTTRSVYHQNKASIVFAWGQKNKKGVRESKNWKWCDLQGSSYSGTVIVKKEKKISCCDSRMVLPTTTSVFQSSLQQVICFSTKDFSLLVETTDLGQGKFLINHFKFRHSSPQKWKQGNTCQQKLQGREILSHKHPLCKKKKSFTTGFQPIQHPFSQTHPDHHHPHSYPTHHHHHWHHHHLFLSQTVLVSFHHPSFPSLLPKRFFQRLSYIPHKCKLNFGLDFFWKIVFNIFTEYGRSTFFLFDTSHRSDFAAKRYLSNPTGYI